MSDPVLERNTVRFACPSFNSTVPKPHFLTEDCYGDDLAIWLRTGLASRGFTFEGPLQEPWGWELKRREATLSIGFLPEPDELWQVMIELEPTVLSWFRRRSTSSVQRLTRALHDRLEEQPDLSGIVWLHLDAMGKESIA
jgi:hypothetical protein